LRELSASHPDVRVIIFSGFDDAAAVGQAVEAGARGYVSKRGDTDDVLEAIRAVIRGEFAHSTA
jgi:two-component system, NarL family, invasion response regulator UvrY